MTNQNELTLHEITSIDGNLAEELASLLIKVVEDGASIGFMLPLNRADALAYWQNLLVEGIVLWIARFNGQLCGANQLHLESKPNGTHRCEVAKLMVDPDFRKKGIGRALMLELEKRAKIESRELIVMDTREGDPSNQLYLSLDYIEGGNIPCYARSVSGKLEGTVFYYKIIVWLKIWWTAKAAAQKGAPITNIHPNPNWFNNHLRWKGFE